MRFVVLAVLATAAPALACPVGALCTSVATPRDEVPAPKRPISLHVNLVDTHDVWNLDEAPPERLANAMPWIWQVLRAEVYERMPRYRDDDLTFVLSPVVVAGQFDTVPGVGVAGDF